MVLQACPEIRDYGPNGAVVSWRDLLSAADVVRSMLGVSPSAYEEACGILGAENAAAVMACILEKGRAHQFGRRPSVRFDAKGRARGFRSDQC